MPMARVLRHFLVALFFLSLTARDVYIIWPLPGSGFIALHVVAVGCGLSLAMGHLRRAILKSS